MRLPYEVGAFAAGVAMARGKIAYVLSEQLKPIRDFFLMFFFFAMGVAFASQGYLSARVADMVQLATVVTMLISSYIVVFKYPTPISVKPRLQRD